MKEEEIVQRIAQLKQEKKEVIELYYRIQGAIQENYKILEQLKGIKCKKLD